MWNFCCQITAFGMLLVSFSAGCSAKDQMPDAVKKALEAAEKIEFFSLNPIQVEDEEFEGEMFHHFEVLGKTTIAEETMQSLLEAFKKGVNDNDGTVAACFLPRHGIRVTFEEKVYDFVICFECMQVQWHIDDEKQEGFRTTKSPATQFNKILSDAEVPLPTK